ncbi:MAG: hypothetical protein K9I85_12155 [Saprospiraceae bacterium]|nr:hypothetical protein [Saprospiraceae bacterium]
MNGNEGMEVDPTHTRELSTAFPVQHNDTEEDRKMDQRVDLRISVE